MLKLLKYIELPHVGTYERRWMRRIMIVLTLPQELVRAVYGVFRAAAYSWRLELTPDDVAAIRAQLAPHST